MGMQQQMDFPINNDHLETQSFRGNVEETRASVTRRMSEPAIQPVPGRTYECETWCRETSRLIAGCLGICLVAVGYAALGGLLFSSIESKAASMAAAASTSSEATEAQASTRGLGRDEE